ncbi:MAG: response regulator transcription factor [Pseudomonadota bacterium]
MTPKRKIVLVDDDPSLTDALVEQLELYEEFDAEALNDPGEAMRRLQTAGTDEAAPPVDLLIMDVDLGTMDGREAVRMLRAKGFSAPVIMLTGHDSDADTILGLEAGANDYVTKPFRFAVLLARIRAQLRQHESSEDATFRVGPYTFKPAAKLLLTDDDKKVRLTEKEVAILRYLYKAGRKPVARDTLLKEVWGYNAGVTTHTLETHVYRLRQKIEPDPTNARLLVTEAGGYKLMP